MSKHITFVTGNIEKAKELMNIIGGGVPALIITKNLEISELQGEITDICAEKCRQAAKQIQGPVIVEDTSLCCNALQGLPGPYIKWFEKKLGPEGVSKLLAGYSDKSAQAVCTLGFSEGIDQDVKLFQGRIDGIIVEPRGPQNFGWDACFQPIGFSRTFAEMEKGEKNKISHRFMATEALKKYLIHKYTQNVS